MPVFDAFLKVEGLRGEMKVETVEGEPKAADRFAIDWADEVALGGPDTAPDDGGFVVESGGEGAIAGIVIATISDNNRLDTNWIDNFVVESGDTNIGGGEL